jgi:hypothetical protein
VGKDDPSQRGQQFQPIIKTARPNSAGPGGRQERSLVFS